MNRAFNCGVVIPCLNEAANVAALVQGARQHVRTVLVVDDGSVDATAAIARQHGAKVISLGRNHGKGAAIHRGLQALERDKLERAILMDGDGQHRPSDIPLFIERAERTGAHLVIGNRMQRANVIPWGRRQVNRWMSRRISKLAGQPLPDTQCGFRLVRLQAWRSLELRTRRFETESEMVLTFARGGYRIEFVPIEVIGHGPASHINICTDTLRWFRWWGQSWWTELRAAPHKAEKRLSRASLSPR